MWMMLAVLGGCSAEEITDPLGWIAEGYVTTTSSSADVTRVESQLTYVPVGAPVEVSTQLVQDRDLEQEDPEIPWRSVRVRAGTLDFTLTGLDTDASYGLEDSAYLTYEQAVLEAFAIDEQGVPALYARDWVLGFEESVPAASGPIARRIEFHLERVDVF